VTVSRRKGDAGLSDVLHSRIIRRHQQCERCHDTTGPFDCAHIVRRRYSATRCDEDNSWCLCRSCHVKVDGDPAEFIDLVDATIGRDKYQELRTKANGGHGTTSTLFWRGERERLTARCVELGLSAKWRI